MADNYRPKANRPALCILPGCTEIFALNYDVDATVNDGSCKSGNLYIVQVILNLIQYK